MQQCVQRLMACGAALTLVACSIDLSIPDAPQPGSLVGQVSTQGRVSAENLPVSLLDEDGARQMVRTDTEGKFLFEPLPPRLYSVEVKLDGFATLLSVPTRVRSGQRVDVGVLEPVFLQGTDAEGRLKGKVTAMGGGDVNGARVEFRLGANMDLIETTTVAGDGVFE